MENAERIPAFVNSASGTAEGAREALATGSFDVHEVPAAELEARILETLGSNPRRILIAGGDGSIRTAAQAVAGKDVELAVLPSGTLNHFAKDHGIPTDLDEAARVAAAGVVVTADAGRVGGKLFHGTSSVGAYVVFMRTREKLEPRLGYRLSTIIAGIWTFIRMPAIAVEIEIEGKKQTLRTPLLFIAVGEREVQLPTLGGRVPDGRRGLHVMVVRGRKRARLFFLALDAVANGIEDASRQPELDAFIVDGCKITMRRKHARIALDGESEIMDTPLEYSFERDILRVVVADTTKDDGEASPSV